jgi:hypothetical protein
VAAILALSPLCACGRYYEVTEPSSGRAYYTRDVDQQARTGVVRFKDARTNSRVTLQSSQVRKISRSEYREGLAK